jgi:hypothetical protein
VITGSEMHQKDTAENYVQCALAKDVKTIEEIAA